MVNTRPRVLHVVDRASGGVPLAVRDYIGHTPDVSHIILSPFSQGRPNPIWDGLAADHRALGQGTVARIGAVRAAVRTLRPDAVHAHSSFSGLYARTACSASRQRVVYSPHCFKFDDPDANRWLRKATLLAERLLARRTSVFAVLSPHEESLARSLGGSEKAVIVPNTPTLPTRERRPHHVGRRFRVGMIGRLALQKDPDFFRSIKRMVDAENADIDWVWIGDGDDAFRARLESDSVEVTGWLPSQRLVEELDRLDLYVHSAAYEGFPLSVLDAAARRIPVFARRIPALEGTPIALFDDPGDAVAMVGRAKLDARYRESLVDRGDMLLDSMNPGLQRDRLRDVWGLHAG